MNENIKMPSTNPYQDSRNIYIILFFLGNAPVFVQPSPPYSTTIPEGSAFQLSVIVTDADADLTGLTLGTATPSNIFTVSFLKSLLCALSLLELFVNHTYSHNRTGSYYMNHSCRLYIYILSNICKSIHSSFLFQLKW